MRYRLLRHPDVAHDLRAIENFIAEYAGPAIALRKLMEIEHTLHRIAENPHIGSIRDEIYPGLRAIPSARKGVITFVVNEELKAVHVVSITYAGAEWFATIERRTAR